VWVLTQQIASIAKPFLEIVAAIVLFYTPSSKTMKAMHIGSDVPATKPAKNPGRVHVGKKLGEHNHKAHETKNKLKRQQKTKRLLRRTTNHPLTSKKGCLAAKFFPPGDSSSQLLGRTTIGGTKLQLGEGRKTKRKCNTRSKIKWCFDACHDCV